jgi:hypothetical protein
MSFVPVQRTIRLELMLEDPLASHNIGPQGVMIPTLGEQGFILLHSMAQWGLASALHMKVGIREVVAESYRQSTRLVTSAP